MSLEKEPVENVPVEVESIKKLKKKKKKAEKATEEIPEVVKGDKKKKKKEKSKKRSHEEEELSTDAAKRPKLTGTDGWKYETHPDLIKVPESEIKAFLQKHSVEHQDASDMNQYRPIMDFKYVNFPQEIQDTLNEMKFKAPTAIQATSWPSVLSGRDMVGIAATGSGKTLSFGIPAFIHVCNNKKNKKQQGHGTVQQATPSVLVIAPTRELAIQIQNAFQTFATRLDFRTTCIYGGVPKYEQKKALCEKGGVDIVVATPGRLMDLIQEDILSLKDVGFLVLDEADRMLDMGFEKDIKKIVSTITRPQRQTVMFSATWPPQIQSLAMTYMRQPCRVTIGQTDKLAANTSITQHVTVVQPHEKDATLVQLLKKYHASRKNRVLIFVLYKKEAPRVEGHLKRNGWNNVRSIHGDMSQQARIESLEAFRDGSCPLLIATDVAARGLDIPNVEYVINYTYPLTTEEYCHRIGRTGRAGNTGISHTLFTVHDKAHSGALINVLKGAQQHVPEDLFKFGTTVKKKLDPNYGAFVKENVDMSKKGTKIVFDSDEE